MNKIIQCIRDISRPFRMAVKKLFMPENERVAASNYHLVDELENRVFNYVVSKTNVKKKKDHVIYTCITGEYDSLIQQTYYNEDYNYVCFTDNQDWIKKEVIGMWQIRPLVKTEYSNALNNRWHKTHPYDLFLDFIDSIYIDGNIDILSKEFFNRIKEKEFSELVLPRHFARNCIYKEIKELKKTNKVSREYLCSTKKFLIEKSFPKDYGLTENNIIYRKHSSETVKRIMDEWWNLILNLVPRDQLTLSYVLWKNNISIDDISIENIRLFHDEVAMYFGRHK